MFGRSNKSGSAAPKPSRRTTHAVYETTRTPKVNDGFTNHFRTISEHFGLQNLSVVGEGFNIITGNETLWNEYANLLVEGVDEVTGTEEKEGESVTVDDLTGNSVVEDCRTLLDNARRSVLMEGLAGTTGVAAVMFPVIRKLWARVAIRAAFPTETVTKPRFDIPQLEPHLILPDGSKIALPSGAKGLNSQRILLTPLGFNDLWKTTAQLNSNLITTTSGASVAAGDAIDTNFAIVAAKIRVPVNTAPSGNLSTTSGSDVEVVCDIKLDRDDNFGGFVSAVGTGADTNPVTISDFISGHLNRETGVLTINTTLSSTGTAMQGVYEIKVRGYLSAEFNNQATQIGFDLVNYRLSIGTGHPLMASLPSEFLQDTAAMYSLDGAAELVELMSNFQAVEVDKNMALFLIDELSKQSSTYQADHIRSFSVIPAANFNYSPKEWREEVKVTIDYLADQIISDNDYTGVYFVLIGHPQDINGVIVNANWVWTNGASAEVGGATVNYNIGAMSGARSYTVVSSTNLTKGALHLFAVPTTPSQLTYKYFPYVFSLDTNPGYRNPNRPNVPAIRMTRRDIIASFNPAVARIDIIGNNGQVPAGRTW